MFVRHVTRMQAIRAGRLLDQIQVQAVPHMREQAHRAFVERLVDDARGVVEEVADDGAEAVIWNGTVLRTARAIKQTAFKMLAPGAVA